MEKYAKNPLVLAGGAGLVASVLSFIDHKVNTEDEFVPDFGRYLKIFLGLSSIQYNSHYHLQGVCRKQYNSTLLLLSNHL